MTIPQIIIIGMLIMGMSIIGIAIAIAIAIATMVEIAPDPEAVTKPVGFEHAKCLVRNRGVGTDASGECGLGFCHTAAGANGG